MLKQLTLYQELRKKITFFVHKLSLNQTVNTIGRKLSLSLTDILTTALFKHLAQITTKKKLWELLELPCSYKTLVVNLNRFSCLALKMLFILLRYNRLNPHLVKHIDSTDIPVCSARKAKYHQTMQALSDWGKTGKGWFYGLKLHIISDLEGRLLSLKFTRGNTDDRAVVIDLSQDLQGIFVADTGYVSQDLAYEFYLNVHNLLAVFCNSLIQLLRPKGICLEKGKWTDLELQIEQALRNGLLPDQTVDFRSAFRMRRLRFVIERVILDDKQ